MVLKPGYIIITIQTHSIQIHRLGRGIQHYPCTSAQHVLARGNTHLPNRTAHLRGSVLARGNTHQPNQTAQLHSHTLWLPQGFGTLPYGKPPTRGIRLPCPVGPYNVSFPARAGIPFLVEGSNPQLGLPL